MSETDSMHRRAVRTATVAAMAVAVIVGGAAPALADPAEPTNYESRVTDVDPYTPYVEIAVAGGDSFLTVAVAPEHTVEVRGYFHEPYLKVDADGSVWVNLNSPAHYINHNRYGTGGTPTNASADAEPDWEEVGSNGRYAWHDHRTHWMSPDLPPTVGGTRAEIVFPWNLPIVVDGVETTVSGQLLWYPSANPVGPIMLGLVGLAPLAFLRRRRVFPVAIAAAVAGMFALLAATGEYLATPAPGRGLPVTPIVPALVIVAAVLAIGLDRSPLRAWAAVLIASFGLILYATQSLATLTAPILPSSLPVPLERACVAIAAWVGMATAVLAALGLWGATRTNADTRPDDIAVG
jgi:hypothetical protein